MATARLRCWWARRPRGTPAMKRGRCGSRRLRFFWTRITTRVEIAIPGVPASIAIGDFDGDGKPDVAVGFRAPARERQGGVVVLLNRTESATAAIRFAEPIVVAFDHAVDFVAAADLDGDGRSDLFAAWCGSGVEPCGAASLLNRAVPGGTIRFASVEVPLGVEHAAN